MQYQALTDNLAIAHNNILLSYDLAQGPPTLEISFGFFFAEVTE